MSEDYDPLADESVPSVSFDKAPIGTSHTGRVLEAPKLVQSRDFDTGDAATWPDGNPKMSVVVVLEVDGEKRSVWAQKPSSMYAALADAQRVAGERIKVGGTLTVQLASEKPHENKRFNAIKQYVASYTAPAAADPLSDDKPPF